MKLPYEPTIGTVDYKVLEILKDLCPDFAPYNYLKNFDLYKGSLLGGTNIYFKNGINDSKGMVTSKTNIKLYGLDKYPYNFQTRATHSGKAEYGWSGEVMLNLLKELQLQKNKTNADSKVLCLATGQTYDLVLQTHITAHPLSSPYPKKYPEYVAPIKKGGSLEFLFKVIDIVDCLPDDIYEHKEKLAEHQFLNLKKYHESGKKSFGYSKSETIYRFYIMDVKAHIVQPFKRKNIQISTYINLNDIPLQNIIDKENDCNDGFAINVTDNTEIHEGHLVRLMVNRYERSPDARIKCIEYHGLSCKICETNFGEKYGEIGEGFIHVHHLKPLHTIGEDYIVDYKNDLIPVCPNCHAMIHRIENVENMTIEEIKKILL